MTVLRPKTRSGPSDAVPLDAPKQNFLDKSGAAVRTVEIAAAELRYGRPVLLRTEGSEPRTFAGMALDTASRENYERFAASSGGRHSLYLTPERAGILGIGAQNAALLALKGASIARARDIGYQRRALASEEIGPGSWSEAPDALFHLVALTRLALLLPALVVTEIAEGDESFSGLATVTPEDIRRADAAETRFEIVARTPVPLKDIGAAEFVVFRGGLSQRDQIAIVVGTPDLSRPVPTRIHSSCLTGDLFGSLKCDCGDQLREGLRLIEQHGGGVLLYLDQEGRGTGIGAKMMAYGYQNHGLDTIDADATLGFGPDPRRYGAAVAMLKALGISNVELLTNNPRKGAFLADAGIAVTRLTSVLGEVTAENENYLRTKAERAGHRLDVPAIMAALSDR